MLKITALISTRWECLHYKAIDDWYGTKKEISQKDVEQILDATIKRAKHKLGRKIVGIFKTKDKDDLQILKEADFNIK